MAFDKRSLDDYVEVHERIAEFKEKFPDGSLQCQIVDSKIEPVYFDPEYWEEDGKNEKGEPVKKGDLKYPAETKLRGYVVMQAYAYRTPDDPKPGIGTSTMQLPGDTPYTRGSEFENCETSAWGRALAAIGMKIKRGIATKDEIENKRGDVSRGRLKMTPDAGAGAGAARRPPNTSGDVWIGAKPFSPRGESPNKADQGDIARIWAEGVRLWGAAGAKDWFKDRFLETKETEWPVKAWPDVQAFQLAQWWNLINAAKGSLGVTPELEPTDPPPANEEYSQGDNIDFETQEEERSRIDGQRGGD